MRNPLIITLTLALALALAACGKKKDEKKTDAPAPAGMQADGMSPDMAGTPDLAPTPPGKTGGGTVCALPDGARIVKDTTFAKDCKLTVEDGLELDEGATLTLEPGVRLAFKVDRGLVVKNGKLVAKGTAEAPIVLTSANPTPAAGDWNGVIFDEEHLLGQVLEFVTVEYAGHENFTSHKGGVVVNASQGDGRLTITNCVIRNNAENGLVNLADKAAFAKFEGNTFEKNGGNAMHLLAQTLGSVADGNKYDEKITFSGRISRTATFPKVTVPFYVDGNLDVGDDATPPTLTIPEGAVLRFKGETGLFVAADGTGALVAKKVTFTSHSPTPKSGDWYGVTLREKTTGTTLEECTLEFAGKDGPIGTGALVIEGDNVVPAGATIQKLAIKGAAKAFGGPEAACAELAKADHANTLDDKPFSCPKE